MQRGDNSIQTWWSEIPLVTKVVVVSTLGLAVLTQFQYSRHDQMALIWPYVTEKKEVYRLYTSFFYAGSFSVNFLLHLMVLYENFKRYELMAFNTGAGGNSADFLWMILLCMGVLLIISYFFDLYFLSEPLLYVILYVWSRREPNAVLNLFGFVFKAIYLPWVYIAIRLFMGSEITEPIIGVVVGHCYYYCVTSFPQTFGFRIIFTPRFCSDLVRLLTGLSPVPTDRFDVPVYARPPAPQAPQAPQPAGNENQENRNDNNNNNNNLRYRGTDVRRPGYDWGQGRPLGGQ